MNFKSLILSTIGFILIIVIFTMMPKLKKSPLFNSEITYRYEVIVIDSCEYIICTSGEVGMRDNIEIIHKANCKYHEED